MIPCWTPSSAVFCWTCLSTGSSSTIPGRHRNRHLGSNRNLDMKFLIMNEDISQTISTNERKNKRHGNEEVPSTVTSANASSFSSPTNSFPTTRNNESDIVMVFKKKIAPCPPRAREEKIEHHIRNDLREDRRPCRYHGTSVGCRNQLLQPVSPYQELVGVRDLCGEVSSSSSSSAHSRRCLTAQSRQDRDDDAARQPVWSRRDNQQERRSGVAIAHHMVPSYKVNARRRSPTHFRSGIAGGNCAHGIPRMIAIPTQPTYSEDSELSLEGLWRTGRLRASRLTPRSSFHDLARPNYNFHHLHRVSMKSSENELWPSDEDMSPRK
jgi:hypothetical protein